MILNFCYIWEMFVMLLAHLKSRLLDMYSYSIPRNNFRHNVLKSRNEDLCMTHMN